MFSNLDSISEHPAYVLGRTIFYDDKTIVSPSSWVFKVHAVMKPLNLRLASVLSKLLIRRPSILDIRLC